ncbi:type 1 fimbrial protein [Ideonella sp. 4Y16]|uniref:Type 1 fimbrial protein n=1 Tax=Ideonella aquatica TaxID=2824119 RepID=A0A940YJ30_9BURK|nr:MULTISPECIES: type 1 fimbrial protein [Ideonella]MBQ0946162.1 type 1 fimbrial protein [Ideonella alba]MBQ0960414.1 type 1 fimbrial protein [Ideonella aquatica]
MKKILTLVALAAAAALPMAAQASDGSLTFNGALTSTTCTVTAGSANQTITLPTLDIGTLAATGLTAGDTAFAISTTGATCTATTATAYFESNANVDTGSGRLNSTGTAANTQLQLLNKSGTVIDLSKPSGSQNVNSAAVTGGNSTSDFIVRYYATGATTAGSVASAISFSMVYQ